MHKYPTNLTDKQWQVIKNMLDPKERFRKYSLRSVFDGILYIVKTGVQWRMLPSDFAPWQTVYYYFSKWWRFRSKGLQKTDDYFGVKPPKKDPIINKKGRELGSRASIFRSIATQLS